MLQEKAVLTVIILSSDVFNFPLILKDQRKAGKEDERK